MKIIQSFWSKPHLKSGSFDLALEYLQISARCIKKLGYELELFTDEKGKSCISKNSAFDKIRTDLEQLNKKNFPTELWSLAKIYSLEIALRETTEPVVHIDGDIFFKRADLIKKIIESEWHILVQSKENPAHYYFCYDKSLDMFLNLFSIHNPFEQMIIKNYNYTYNCGFLGFKNIKHFQEYSRRYYTLYNLVCKDEDKLKQFLCIKKVMEKTYWHRGVVDINCILEQVQLTNFASEFNLYVKEVIPVCKWGDKQNLMTVCNSHTGLEFIHLAGDKKYQDKQIYLSIKDYVDS